MGRYNNKLGIYKEGCGIENVIMSWGHDEYLYHVSILCEALKGEYRKILPIIYGGKIVETNRSDLKTVKKMQKRELIFRPECQICFN